MERLKIIKELNNVANILEDNGRISEASQITNVLIKIAQVTPPVGSGTSVQNSTQGQQTQGQESEQNLLTPEQIANIEKNKQKAFQAYRQRFIDMLKLRSLAEEYRKKAKITNTPEYFIDADGYKIRDEKRLYVGKTLDELIQNFKKLNIGLKNPEQELEQEKYAEKVAQDILSAAFWPDPMSDPSITQKINKEYMLGYNYLAGTYYIAKVSDKNDVVDKKDINELGKVFAKLGEYYKNNQNKFPEKISKLLYNQDYLDPNKIIMDAFKEDKGKKWDYINRYDKHPNFDDIRRGFVQEHNRREPNQSNHISMDRPATLNTA